MPTVSDTAPTNQNSDDRRVALVTGGATGIGAACCRTLAAEGFRVVIHCNGNINAARELATEMPDAIVMQADLRDSDAIETLIRELREHTSTLDVLVNNAGVTRDAETATMKLDDFDAVAALGRGTWYLTKLVLRRFMLRAGSGRIINISSVVGHTGNRGQVPYSMEKAGLDAMTKSLAQELRGREILVNSIAPGFIDTPMTEVLPESVRSDILRRVPLERLGRPEEVADVVAFLATRGSYITGSVLHVNGGLYGG